MAPVGAGETRRFQGRQAYPTPAATVAGDGTTTIVLGPERRSDCPEGNWVQTLPGKGWFPSCASTARPSGSSTSAGSTTAGRRASTGPGGRAKSRSLPERGPGHGQRSVAPAAPRHGPPPGRSASHPPPATLLACAESAGRGRSRSQARALIVMPATSAELSLGAGSSVALHQGILRARP